MVSLFVPGRICIFGEHSDWAGLQRVINADIIPGAAIVTGIEQGIYADVEKSDKFVMRNESEELKDSWIDFESSMQASELREIAASGGYFSYVAGVASYVNENHHVGGLKITITSMTLPIKSGLSSSAAICVLVARAFNILYSLNLSTMGEMTIAFKGEQRTISRCGRLDQACAFGISPVLMNFDGDEISVERLVVKNPLYLVFASLNGKKDTIKILSDLNKCYPFANNDLEKNVHSALGKDNHAIISKAMTYMQSGDTGAFGRLMTEAQAVFDTKVAPACYEELRAPILHSVLNDEKIKALTFGGKGVGSQGDGSVQFLAKDAACQSQLDSYLKEKGLSSYKLTIQPRYGVHKAIIPVAGFGTRLYPATRMIRKEFIPIIDKDGLAKPVILILLEELYNSGIDEICLVVGSETEIEMYKKFFNQPLSEEHIKKLPKKMQEYENKIMDIGKLLTFRVQNDRKGFGHAVYQCRDFCANEPVLLLLGDTIYRSGMGKTCSLQLIEAFDRLNQPLVSIHEIALEQVGNCGVLTGAWEDKSETILRAGQFVEKPTRQFAEDYLAVEGTDSSKRYYSVFGQYILTQDVFNELGTNIANEITEKNSDEYGLTEALAACIGKTGLAGIVLNGHMYDIGNTDAYRNAMKFFAGESGF